MRLFWSATGDAPAGALAGQTEWWVVVPGVIVPGLAILWLLRRLERTVYA
jgi:hypothetical protein